MADANFNLGQTNVMWESVFEVRRCQFQVTLKDFQWLVSRHDNVLYVNRI